MKEEREKEMIYERSKKRVRKFDPWLAFPKSGLLPDFPFWVCGVLRAENVKKESGDEVFLFGTVVDEFVSSFGCAYASCEVWMSPHQVVGISGFLLGTLSSA